MTIWQSVNRTEQAIIDWVRQLELGKWHYIIKLGLGNAKDTGIKYVSEVRGIFLASAGTTRFVVLFSRAKKCDYTIYVRYMYKYLKTGVIIGDCASSDEPLAQWAKHTPHYFSLSLSLPLSPSHACGVCLHLSRSYRSFEWWYDRNVKFHVLKDSGVPRGGSNCPCLPENTGYIPIYTQILDTYRKQHDTKLKSIKNATQKLMGNR